MKDNILINGPNLHPKSGTVKQLIVFLHGWGSNGDDLIQLSPFFANEFSDTLFLSPNGPEECPQNPFGGRQWFGLDFLPDGSIDRKETPQKAKNAITSYFNTVFKKPSKVSKKAAKIVDEEDVAPKGVGDADTFGIYGTPNCGKGEPNQVIRVGHASPTCLFENIQIFGGV